MTAAAPTRRRTIRRVFAPLAAKVGLGITAVVLFIALFGPFFAPHGPADIVGIPYQSPTSAFPLGTDFVGRDVLSRVLWGGRTVVGLAGLATVIAYVIGATIGLVAGYTRTLLDSTLMRMMDVILAFPAILLLLVLATGAGSSAAVLVLGIALVHIPGVARIIRTATAEAAVRGYVEAAVARGESMWSILFKEILPNLSGVIVADAGPRFTVSVLLVASVNFLGLGLQPPSADWALMISENREGLTIQPWALVAPAVLIALLTIGINTAADAVARGMGQSLDLGEARR
jgi:peptide/nickel transport system permease protein